MYAKRSKRDNVLLAEIIILVAILIVAVVCICTTESSCAGNGCADGAYGKADVDLTIDTSGFVNEQVKNNLDLVKWAEIAYENNWGYVYGTWGNVLTESLLTEKVRQYPTDVGENESFIRSSYMGGRVTDCIGLIKGYCWYNGDSDFAYNSNGMPDVGANRLFDEADEKGDISTIPEIPGIAVWADGHIGVYIGDGTVIEAMSTKDGVKMTRVEDRPWTHWCKIPYIEYFE